VHERPAASERASAAHLVSGGVVAVVGAVLSLALVGVPLAMVGGFRPELVLPLTAVGAVAAVRAVSPPRAVMAIDTAALAATAAVVGLVTVANMIWPSQHYTADRDPGAYTITAHWLAERGDLLVTGLEGPFAQDPGLEAGSLAFVDDRREDGRLYAPYAHLNAAVLAAGKWLGGDALLIRTTPLIGAAGLLALFVLLALHVRAWAAAVAVVALAFSLPQVWFSRGTYSEPLAQLLLIGGLALLTVGWRARHLPTVVAAGLALGAVLTARIDGVVTLVPLVAVAAALVAGSGWWRRAGLGLAFGLALSTAVGLADLAWRSPVYLRVHWSLVWPPLVAAGALAVVVPLAVLAARRWSVGAGAWPARARQVTPWAVVAVLVGLWQVRPLVHTVRTDDPNPRLAFLAEREGLGGDRIFDEFSLQWVEWYLGPLALLAAVVGLAIAGRRAGAGRDVWLPLVVLGPAALLYWWQPNIAFDHIWAMRRFVPAALPLVALGLAVALDASWARSRAGRPLAAGLAAVAVAVPALIWVPLASARELQISRHALGLVCDAVGEDGAAVFLAGYGVDEQLPVAARVVCEVPTASGPPERDYRRLQQAWAAEGRRLVLVASAAAPIPEGLVVVDAVDYPVEALEVTVTRRPEHLERNRAGLVVLEP
jgi:hypothetical protein